MDFNLGIPANKPYAISEFLRIRLRRSRPWPKNGMWLAESCLLKSHKILKVTLKNKEQTSGGKITFGNEVVEEALNELEPVYLGSVQRHRDHRFPY